MILGHPGDPLTLQQTAMSQAQMLMKYPIKVSLPWPARYTRPTLTCFTQPALKTRISAVEAISVAYYGELRFWILIAQNGGRVSTQAVYMAAQQSSCLKASYKVLKVTY
jgi:hypothetical protein